MFHRDILVMDGNATCFFHSHSDLIQNYECGEYMCFCVKPFRKDWSTLHKLVLCLVCDNKFLRYGATLKRFYYVNLVRIELYFIIIIFHSQQYLCKYSFHLSDSRLI